MLYLVLTKAIGIVLVFSFFFVLFFVWIKKFQLIVVAILIVCVLLIYAVFLKNFGWSQWSLKRIIESINHKYNLRMVIINYVQNYNDKFTSDFLLLITLNYKTDTIGYFYQQLLNLGVVHLFVVSGLHLSLLNFLLRKFLPATFSFLVIFFYGLLLGLSFGVLRVLMNMLIRLVNKKTNNSYLQINHTCISGLIIYFLNPWSVFDLGFQLSFIGAIVLNFNCFLSSKLKHVAWLLNSFIINLLIGPILLYVNYKINLLTVFYSWLMTPLVCACYFVCVIVLPFKFCWPILTVLLKLLTLVVNQFEQLSFYFYLNVKLINAWYIFAYYLIWLGVFIFIYQRFEQSSLQTKPNIKRYIHENYW